MAAEVKKEIQLEIAHVLFIDIVGYSKLSINEQRAAIDELTQAVRASEQFQNAEAAARLIKIPTGDGMALVFYKSPEEPVECALEISRALKEHAKIQLRMGAHSGPVSGMIDVNGQANLAGAGLNTAQRVMACGDAGHILLSKRVADDLGEYEHWRPLLHDLGECEVKHGVRVSIVNLHADEVGNPQPPKKFQALKKHRARLRWATIGAAGLVIAALVSASMTLLRSHWSMSQLPAKSIAVLPFENLSEEKQNAFFADGVQDEILTNLARVADLKVISRTSVIAYRDTAGRNLRKIGQELGVAHLLEGSVQRAGNRVRINAQLIDARNDAHLWGQTYDRDLADVFAIQSEIAKAIADQLQARLSPREQAAIERRPTTNVEAFDLYARAKNMFLTMPVSATRQGEYLEAIDRLNQAVARDPSFLQAYCLLARAHDDLYFYGVDHTPERLGQGETAVAAALRLDPDAGEAHLARAEHLYHGYRDYSGALAEIQLAARTLPNDPHVFELTAYIMRRQGKYEEGLRNLQRALQLDPLNLNTVQQIALAYQTARRFPEAAAMWDRALAMKPEQIETKVLRAQVELDWKGDTRPLHQTIDQIRHQEPAAIQRIANSMFLCALAERDVAAAQTALQTLGNNPFGYDQMLFGPKMNEGLIARLANDQDKARAAFTIAREQQEKIVQAQPDYAAAVCLLGLIDAALGRKEEALREGRRAIELVPVANDAFGGANMIQYFAVIAAWVGEKDLALEHLEKAVELPSYTITTYGQLKLLPFWDPLRGDPRFEKIVASLAPK
jgi:TolB-like protein/class 3 adenylate cyclase/cytochrome c-type biogenesis protein CcmH/NrfG